MTSEKTSEYEAMVKAGGAALWEEECQTRPRQRCNELARDVLEAAGVRHFAARLTEDQQLVDRCAVLLTALKEVCDESLDEREGQGPNRNGQFLRISEMMKDFPKLPEAAGIRDSPQHRSGMGVSGPKGVTRPMPDDVVQVLMTEEMARRFESRCLGSNNTRGQTDLAGPVKFREDDVPTYLIGVAESPKDQR